MEALAATGVTDSKKLSAKRRQALLPLLRQLGRERLVLVSAAQIDADNLNQLELDAMVQLIEDGQPACVWIDAPTHPRGIPGFVQRLRARLSYQPDLVVEPKADLNYRVVSAASVFAKQRRDAEIVQLGEVGSGYPSDPVTRAFLKDLLDRGQALPSFVRSRWGTISALRQQSLLG